MILIADSGASKTDWRHIGKDGDIVQYQTAGFNPTYQDLAQLNEEINSIVTSVAGEAITGVFYYGAGCRSEEHREQIASLLSNPFYRG